MHDPIVRDPQVMGGKPCIRGTRVTVGTITGLIAAGHSEAEILELYPYLERADIPAALRYATWLAESFDAELQPA
ncbi:MAG: DUF433 domain-containing protein [Chthoniobacterales bacterium]